jgi:hypothetical protein
VVGLIEIIIIIIVVKNKSDYRSTMGLFIVLVVFELINEILNLTIHKNNVKEDQKNENA